MHLFQISSALLLALDIAQGFHFSKTPHRYEIGTFGGHVPKAVKVIKVTNTVTVPVPVPVPYTKHIPFPVSVPKPIPYAVPQPIPVEVTKPILIPQAIPFEVPKPYPVPQPLQNLPLPNLQPLQVQEQLPLSNLQPLQVQQQPIDFNLQNENSLTSQFLGNDLQNYQGLGFPNFPDLLTLSQFQGGQIKTPEQAAPQQSPAIQQVSMPQEIAMSQPAAMPQQMTMSAPAEMMMAAQLPASQEKPSEPMAMENPPQMATPPEEKPAQEMLMSLPPGMTGEPQPQESERKAATQQSTGISAPSDFLHAPQIRANQVSDYLAYLSYGHGHSGLQQFLQANANFNNRAREEQNQADLRAFGGQNTQNNFGFPHSSTGFNPPAQLQGGFSPLVQESYGPNRIPFTKLNDYTYGGNYIGQSFESLNKLADHSSFKWK